MIQIIWLKIPFNPLLFLPGHNAGGFEHPMVLSRAGLRYLASCNSCLPTYPAEYNQTSDLQETAKTIKNNPRIWYLATLHLVATRALFISLSLL